MPRLQGPHIFSDAGLCRECARPQAEHRPIACGYPRKDYEHRTPCDGICMYRKNLDDGLLVCCSVCPHCGIPPIDDPNDECEEEDDVPHEHQLDAHIPNAPGQNGEANHLPNCQGVPENEHPVHPEEQPPAPGQTGHAGNADGLAA